MAVAIPFIMVAGAVIGAIGAIRQANAAKAAANFNAQVQEQNAAIARQEAQDALVVQRREDYLRLGAIRAAQGHAGGQMEGSALDVLGDAAAQGEYERQRIVYEGELKARGYQNTATLDRYSGANAQTSGYLKAGTELLGGMSSAYGSYSRMQRVG